MRLVNSLLNVMAVVLFAFGVLAVLADDMSHAAAMFAMSACVRLEGM